MRWRRVRSAHAAWARAATRQIRGFRTHPLILSARPLRISGVSTQRTTTVLFRSSLYEDAVAIVEREYGTDLSLDDIARRVASSRRQLQRAYPETCPTTFRAHRPSVRMDRAAELLARRSLTVRDVAHRVGYRQPAQFAKALPRPPRVAPPALPPPPRRRGRR